MRQMRPFLIAAAVVIATPAVAQDALRAQMQFHELQAQQQIQQQQSVAQHNELMALDARIRTEQAAGRIAAERQPTRLPELTYPAVAPSAPGSEARAAADSATFTGIPDAVLADSNRRVREITQNRR